MPLCHLTSWRQLLAAGSTGSDVLFDLVHWWLLNGAVSSKVGLVYSIDGLVVSIGRHRVWVLPRFTVIAVKAMERSPTAATRLHPTVGYPVLQTDCPYHWHHSISIPRRTVGAKSSSAGAHWHHGHWKITDCTPGDERVRLIEVCIHVVALFGTNLG